MSNLKQKRFVDTDYFHEQLDSTTVEVEGSHISATETKIGYMTDVEILGNTIQDEEDLADIRSVGDKVEGQELYEIPVLSRGKNLFDGKLEQGAYNNQGIKTTTASNYALRSVNKINVSPNTTYVFSVEEYSSFLYVCQYHNDTFIKQSSVGASRIITTTENTNYITFNTNNNGSTLPTISNIQLEEGTQATPYEPYQEDKLTILSPTPLEKVGDAADRIIEKDGVWGVEKNTIRKSLTASSVAHNGTVNGLTEYIIDTLENSDTTITSNVICNKLVNKFSTTEEGCFVTKNQFRVRVLTNTYPNTESIKNEVINNKWYIIYKSAQPQFIPLPHDQQIKLRTFANKTNISFLTEIEGTIKAQVPKSLGATVNTHTEQINNLNKELDRVKKLEESTVSTVTTESDFTTVEATSNGYFEDVKLEGKTLVNHLCNSENTVSSTSATNKSYVGLQLGKTYTAVVYVIENNNNKPFYPFRITYSDNVQVTIPQSVYPKGSVITHKFELADKQIRTIWVNWCSTYESSDIITTKTLLLEGDHTQNPPSFFEGLKSVGEDTDEIVVSSVNNGNMIDLSNITEGYYIGKTNAKITESNSFYCNDLIDILPSMNISLRNSGGNQVGIFRYFTKDKEFISGEECNTNTSLKIPQNARYLGISFYNRLNIKDTLYVGVSGTMNDVNHQSDKKRLLYYNEETQTWEKPVLREWDSIEKHSDGKYYYHQRSGEVVLNGSENWTLETSTGYLFTPKYDIIRVDNYTDKMLCDKFNTIINKSYDLNGITGYGNLNEYPNQNWIYIKHSNFSDVESIKQWLQTNNVTVVYQLAEEKVYECTNIDLIAYANETNYLVESGVLSPKTTLKVHNNISNVVSLLQKKVSLLESNVKASQEVQDMMILETDMRMLDIELALMEFAPMKLNLGGSDMLRSATYFNFLKNHIVNETYEKEYLENVMNKYLATGRINQDEYDELYKMLYPPVYDIELPIER